jgi:3-hydroxyacyl-[acyl-carrier-protein] dehydratase
MRFLLVDAIESHEPGQAISGVKNVTMSEDFFTHHFPGVPVMPGLLLVEAMVQLARWMIIAESGYLTSGLLASIEQVKFREYVAPGEQVLLHLDVLASDDVGRHFRGTAQVGGKDRVIAAFALRDVPLGELDDPDAARQAFAILWRHGDPRRRK